MRHLKNIYIKYHIMILTSQEYVSLMFYMKQKIFLTELAIV